MLSISVCNHTRDSPGGVSINPNNSNRPEWSPIRSFIKPILKSLVILAI